MTTFTGQGGVSTYQAIVLKGALKMYAAHGMRVNRAYTPTAMLKTAGNITGQTFKRGQYTQALEALEAWIEANGTTGS